MNPFIRHPHNHTRTPIRAEIPAVREGDNGVVTMRLYEAIDSAGDWGISAREFTQALDGLPDDTTEIRLHINSPGGECWEALAILNALRQHPARVVTIVDGLAASAASLVALAGDEVIMARNSELMVHSPWALCLGNASDMTKMAADLIHEDANMASIYADKAGGTVEDWMAVMAAETWYSDAEAVKAGLADRVLPKDPKDADKAKARFDLAIFAHAGRAQAPAPQAPASPSGPHNSTTQKEGSPPVTVTDETLSTLRQRLGCEDDADEATIVAAFDAALAEQAAAPPADMPPAVLPDGVVTIDSAQLEELQVAARAGVAARAQQESERREGLVNAAVQDGRIAPARRDAWLARLAADDGEAQTLADLAPGLVPVAPMGYVGAEETDTNTADGVRATAAYKNWSRS